jgi:hypothetical protein
MSTSYTAGESADAGAEERIKPNQKTQQPRFEAGISGNIRVSFDFVITVHLFNRPPIA